jgi:diacylglycerol O-acyltransferase / wax synthase
LKQLSALDTQFLAIENDRNYGHTGGLAVLDPSTAPGGELTLEMLKDFIASRLHLIAPFTSRLAQVPFNLDWPYWVTDEHFDLGYHVREIALPRPGDLGQLTEQVGRNSDGHVIERPPVKAPRGPYGAAVSPHRIFGFGSMPLPDIKAVKNAFAVKVNDVVVTLVAGAVRANLLERGELPGQPLVVFVPISVRTEEERGTFGNKVSAMMVALPTHLDDPLERLEFSHQTLSIGKENHDALPVETMRDISTLVPPALHTRAARVATRLSGRFTRPPWNVIVSNVPGPPVDLYCCGARLEAMYPLSIISDGMGLNVTVMSYRDSVDIGITADREQTPEVQEIVGFMHEELAELLQCIPAA